MCLYSIEIIYILTDGSTASKMTEPKRARAPARSADPTEQTDDRPTTPPSAGILLPPAWVGERGLPVGVPIDFEELADGSLLLRPAFSPPRPETITIPVSGSSAPEHLFRQLVAAYLNGATEFVLVAPDGVPDGVRRVARAFAERTATPEVVSDDGQVLLLRERPASLDPPVDELVREMTVAVRAMHETAGRILEAGGHAEADLLPEQDDEVDRLAWRAERTVVRHRGHGRAGLPESVATDDPVASLLLVRALERIADHAVSLGEQAARLSECSVAPTVKSSLHAYHTQAIDYLAAALELNDAPAVRRANELLDTGTALHLAHRTISESLLTRAGAGPLSPLASASLGLVLQSIDRTVAYAEDIVELGLDRAVAAQLLLAPTLPNEWPAGEPGAQSPPTSAA